MVSPRPVSGPNGEGVRSEGPWERQGGPIRTHRASGAGRLRGRRGPSVRSRWRGERRETQPDGAGKCPEPRKGRGQRSRPGPARLQAKLRAAAGEGKPPGDVQEAVAKPLRPRAGELAGEQQRLRPRDEVVGDEDVLKPDGIHVEVAEGQL